MAEQYTSIRVIMDKLMRHPLLADLTLETVVDYTVDFFRIVGVPRMFVDKVVTIPVTNYIGTLPLDWIDTIQISFNNRRIRYSSDSFHLLQDGTTTNNPDVGNEATFVIQGGNIVTSMSDGEIILSYRALLTDSNGFPMLPDNSNFTRALEAYIKVQVFTILYDLGKLHQNVLANTQSQYAFAVGSCENEFKRLDLSKAETLFNSFRTLIIRDHQFQEGFINNGRKENFKH
jgi:hypothetical protein